jgi:hypothetical protein
MASDKPKTPSSLPPETTEIDSSWDDDNLDPLLQRLGFERRGGASLELPPEDEDDSDEDRVTAIPDVPMEELARFLMQQGGGSHPGEGRPNAAPTPSPFASPIQRLPTPVVHGPVVHTPGMARPPSAFRDSPTEPPPAVRPVARRRPAVESGPPEPTSDGNRASAPSIEIEGVPLELDDFGLGLDGYPLSSRAPGAADGSDLGSLAPGRPSERDLPPPTVDYRGLGPVPLLALRHGGAQEEPEDERDSAPPTVDLSRAPAAREALELERVRLELKDRYAVGDFSGALVMAERILERSPDDPDAKRYAQNCRDVLMQMYTARLGRMDQRVRVIVPPEQIRWLSLDHRAGFLLSLVENAVSIEELLDVSGMTRLDALRILHTLYEQRVVAFEPG